LTAYQRTSLKTSLAHKGAIQQRRSCFQRSRGQGQGQKTEVLKTPTYLLRFAPYALDAVTMTAMADLADVTDMTAGLV
jgi:hypothetical protein